MITVAGSYSPYDTLPLNAAIPPTYPYPGPICNNYPPLIESFQFLSTACFRIALQHLIHVYEIESAAV